LSFSIGALLLVVLSSLAWGGYDALRKLLAHRIPPLTLLCLLTLAAVPLFAIWVAVDGMPAVAGGWTGYALPALASVLLNIAANLAYIVTLRKAALSVSIPLLSLTPAFAALLAVPLLGERPSLIQGAGILLVVVGAFGLNLPAAERVSPAAALRSWQREPGALWMVAVAFLWALTIPLDKLAVARASGPFHGLVLNAGVAAGALIGLVAQKRLRELGGVREVAGPFVLSLVVSVAALGLQLLAIQVLWVSLVETLKRGIGNVLAVVFGRLLFAEPVTGRKLAAVALMAAGVALLLLA
jgi:drug/metabolite transporter (DMT)-like permease